MSFALDPEKYFEVRSFPLFSIIVLWNKTEVTCFFLAFTFLKTVLKWSMLRSVPLFDSVNIQDDFPKTSNSFNMSSSDGYPKFPIVYIEDETKIQPWNYSLYTQKVWIGNTFKVIVSKSSLIVKSCFDTKIASRLQLAQAQLPGTLLIRILGSHLDSGRVRWVECLCWNGPVVARLGFVIPILFFADFSLFWASVEEVGNLTAFIFLFISMKKTEQSSVIKFVGDRDCLEKIIKENMAEQDLQLF